MSGTPTEIVQLDRIQVTPLGKDIIQAVNKHVPRASSCVPVCCTDQIDTHLLFTYCHKICDESFRDTMVLKALVVEEASSTMIQLTLPYNQSESISLKRLLKKFPLRGICFVWSEREEDPKGFRIQHRRLAPVFYTYYQGFQTGQTLDYVHSSPAMSNYERQRIFWVPQEGAQVTGIVCAPLDAYQNKVSRLTYTFGLKEEGTSWEYAVKEVPFTPTVWVNLGELFGKKFKSSSTYFYRVKGPKGKGWILIQTDHDFNLHHL